MWWWQSRHGLPVPESGSLWRIRADTDDPFPPKHDVTVRVLESAGGWVRYAHAGGVVFHDERLPLAQLYRIFEAV